MNEVNYTKINQIIPIKRQFHNNKPMQLEEAYKP